MLTKNVLLKFVLLAGLLALPGCTQMMTEASETEKARCEALAEATPQRSRSDTQETIEGLGVFYGVFDAVYADVCELPF
jgi:hypothetical protein